MKVYIVAAYHVKDEHKGDNPSQNHFKDDN